MERHWAPGFTVRGNMEMHSPTLHGTTVILCLRCSRSPEDIRGEPGSGRGNSDTPCAAGGILCSQTNASAQGPLLWNLTPLKLGSCSQENIEGFLALFTCICVLPPASEPNSCLWYQVLTREPPSLFQVDTIFFPTSFLKGKFSSQACVVPSHGRRMQVPDAHQSRLQPSAAGQQSPVLLNHCYSPREKRQEKLWNRYTLF